jgi:hypothetical protein
VWGAEYIYKYIGRFQPRPNFSPVNRAKIVSRFFMANISPRDKLEFQFKPGWNLSLHGWNDQVSKWSYIFHFFEEFKIMAVHIYYLTSARMWLHLKIEHTEIKQLKRCWIESRGCLNQFHGCPTTPPPRRLSGILNCTCSQGRAFTFCRLAPGWGICSRLKSRIFIACFAI